MTLHLELKPEVEASLAAQAKAGGVPLEAYVQRAVETLARVQTDSPPDAQEIRTALDKLAEMGKSLPHIESSAFSRDSIYQDHD